MDAGGGSVRKWPNRVQEKDKCVTFLSKFTAPGARPYDKDSHKYLDMMQEVANRTRTRMDISLDDVLSHEGDQLFHDNIKNNSMTYEALFSEAIDDMLPQPTRDITLDVRDILQEQRENEQRQDDGAEGSTLQMFPPELKRRYEVRFISGAKSKPLAIRQVRAAHIGQLCQIRGMVTRVTDVKPLMEVATYTCETCGWEIYQEVKSENFTPVTTCPAPQCVTNSVAGRLQLQTRGSKFTKFQEAKVQELPDQVPMGHIPQTMTVHLVGEVTRSCGPGDMVNITGIFLPKKYTGFRSVRAGLIADTYLKATSVDRLKKSYTEFEVTKEMENEIEAESQTEDIYTRMARSIAPEIFGHEDVKKALLLLLVGGVTRSMNDGMKIRGDINICLMGDPGVAKSQLLKHISTVAPRGIYTTGKGSSGVGLTAAVVRDPVTKDMQLEGGALVLADMGICCIDEFDKMEEGDRTAIHEVMEQQTVSIAKAGITTTLNARCAVLAAANPLYGRYNRRLTPSQNINLPNALLSRFDLLFLILDKADFAGDKAMAEHITYVHRHCKNPDIGFEPLKPEFMKAYIAMARQLDPYIPEDLTNYIVEAYVGLRQQDLDAAQERNGQHIMTARMLLSILRLSQGLARLRFATEVAAEDVDEAMRLVHMSKASLLDESKESEEDPMSRIYGIIRDYAQQREDVKVDFSAMEPMVIKKGFTKEQLQSCLDMYADLDVWHIDPIRSCLQFV